MEELYEKASDVYYEAEKLSTLYDHVIGMFHADEQEGVLLMEVVRTMLDVVLQKSEELSNELRDAYKRGEEVA